MMMTECYKISFIVEHWTLYKNSTSQVGTKKNSFLLTEYTKIFGFKLFFIRVDIFNDESIREIRDFSNVQTYIRPQWTIRQHVS